MTHNEDFINEIYLIVRKYCWKSHCYSEDLVQEMVMHIFEKLDKFDPDKAKFSTWVFKLCHNKRLMLLREDQANKRKANLYTSSLNTVIDGDDTEMLDILADNYDEEDLYKRRIVSEVYSQLSDISKKYFDGVRQVDIAKEYNLSQAQISRIIKKEIRNIKKTLELENE